MLFHQLAMRSLRTMVRVTPRFSRVLARSSEQLALALNTYLQRASSSGGSSAADTSNKRTAQAGGPGRLCSELFKLGETTTPLDVVRLMNRHGFLSDTAFQALLHELFTQRRMKQLEEVLADANLGPAELRLYYRARMDHYLGKPGPKVATLMQLLHSKEAMVPPHQVVGLVMEQVVREEDADGLEEFLAKEQRLVEAFARDSTILGSLRLLIKKERLGAARDLLVRHLASITPRRRFYFLEISHLLFPDGLPRFGIDRHPGWRQVLEDFKARGGRSGNGGWDKLCQYLLDPLKRIPPGDQDLMDIRIDASEADRLNAYILECLESRRPCSLVRLGDGEAYAFESDDIGFGKPELFRSDNGVRERHWWGMELDEKRRRPIAASVREAVAAADIVGIPSVYRIIRDAGTDELAFGANINHRGLGIVLNAMGRQFPIEGKRFTEERCNQILFTGERLDRLIAAAKRTVIVSCWSRDQLARTLSGDFETITIAPHTKVAHSCETDLAKLPLMYERISEQVRAASAPGHLVLVGAGLIGKIFIEEARRQGAVALDAGAVLDYLSGFKTRSIADLV